MSFVGILSGLSRLSLYSRQAPSARSISTNIYPLYFRVTDALCGEPLKKKKRLDPQIIRHREERRKRKLEKAIRKLEKHARQLKPIPEVDIPFKLKDEKKIRTRPAPKMTEELIDKRITLEKEWSRYKHQQSIKDMKTLNTMMASQEKALRELRNESEELYQQAIQLDTSILPILNRSPSILRTPPIPNFDSSDGDYLDVSPTFDGDDARPEPPFNRIEESANS